MKWLALMAVLLIGSSIFYSKSKPQGQLGLQPKGNISSPKDAGNNANLDIEKSKEELQQDKMAAPDFTLKDLNGKNVKLSDYKGKVVILNFWAVWCKYCRQEMPDLNELNKELQTKNDAVILTIDVQETPDTVKDYFSKNNLSLPVLLDSDGSISQKYNVSGFPTTYIINKDGTIFTYMSGATTKENLKEILGKIK